MNQLKRIVLYYTPLSKKKKKYIFKFKKGDVVPRFVQKVEPSSLQQYIKFNVRALVVLDDDGLPTVYPVLKDTYNFYHSDKFRFGNSGTTATVVFDPPKGMADGVKLTGAPTTWSL